MSWVESRLRYLERMEEYRKNARSYIAEVKKAVRLKDPEARVILFGSYIEGGARKDSDIDVLIITRLAADAWERARLRAGLKRLLGEDSPFELHIVTPDEFEGWYLRFIGKYEEVA